MAGVNKVILVGNLGRDPEVRTIEGGAKVASFSIATSEVFKNKDGSKNETTEWHNIVLWRGLAELAEKYLTKGNQVYIEGRIKTRQWEDKDGIKRYTTEIIGDSLTFLGGGKSNQNAGDAPLKESNNDNSPEPIQEADDDLPF